MKTGRNLAERVSLLDSVHFVFHDENLAIHTLTVISFRVSGEINSHSWLTNFKISLFHAMNLAPGKDIGNDRVLNTHPSMVLISDMQLSV